MFDLKLEVPTSQSLTLQTMEEYRRKLARMSFAALLYHALVGDGYSHRQMANAE
jgi:hypothetical protein